MLHSNWIWPTLLVSALAETGAHWYFKARAPNEHEWRALKPDIAKLYHPSDCIAVAPDWGDPLARHALGDELMPLRKVARASDEGCERVITLSLFGAEYRPVTRWTELERLRSGPFAVSVRKNPDWTQARYVFIDHLEPDSLAVSVRQEASTASCPFSDRARQSSGGLGGDPTSPERRYNCPGGGFHWVGATIIDDEHYRPRRCIWAPPSRTGPTTLHFHDVPLGRKLVGYAGGPWLMVRDGLGPAVTLTAVTGSGGPTLSSRFTDTDGWTRFEWDTQALENTTTDVQLTVTGSPSMEQRFCFSLEAI